MGYRITAFGQSWDTEDLTIAEAEVLESDLGCSYLLLNPLVVIGHYRAVLAIFLAREMDPDTARQKVEGQTIRTMGEVTKVDDSIPDYFEDGLPKAEGGPPTDGSSPAAETSDGLPT